MLPEARIYFYDHNPIPGCDWFVDPQNPNNGPVLINPDNIIPAQYGRPQLQQDLTGLIAYNELLKKHKFCNAKVRFSGTGTAEMFNSLKRPAPFCQPPPDYEGFRRRRPNPIPAGYEAPSPMPGLPRFPPPSPRPPSRGYPPLLRMPDPLVPCSPVPPQSPPPANPWWSEDPLYEFGFERFFPRTPPPTSSPLPSVYELDPGTPPPEHLWNRHITDWDEFDPFTPRRFRPPSPPPLIPFSPPGSPLIHLEPEEMVEVRPRGRGFPAYESPPPSRPSSRPGPSSARERVRSLARGREATRQRDSSRGSRRLGPGRSSRPCRSPSPARMMQSPERDPLYARVRLRGSGAYVFARRGWH